MEILQPPELAAPAAAYSHGIAAGNLIFVAGQVAFDDNGNLVGGDDIGAQTRQVIRNVAAVLNSAGASLRDVVSTTVYLTSFDAYPQYNEAYIEAFEGHKPARATVKAELFQPGLLVEMQAIAVKP